MLRKPSRQNILLGVTTIMLFMGVLGGSVFAVPESPPSPAPSTPSGGQSQSTSTPNVDPYYGTPNACPDGQTHLNLPNEGVNNRVCCPNGSETDAQDCTFSKYLNPTITLLSIVTGTLVVIGMIMGGIQYAASAGDPQKAAAGKGKIVKAFYGLAAFLFLYSALQFLSPGGLTNKPVPAPPSKEATTIAERCAKTFLGIKPWYIYLPDTIFKGGGDKDGKNDTCDITNFTWVAPETSKTRSNIPAVVLAIADALVRIAGFVAVAFVIVGGFKYVTSQGDPESTKRAKDSIVNALIGLVIAVVATMIVAYIGKRLA